MELEETALKGCIILKPKVFEDCRGYFYESFNSATFERLTGMSGTFVQDNQSCSSYGVIRTLHAQTGEHTPDLNIDWLIDEDRRILAKKKIWLYRTFQQNKYE